MSKPSSIEENPSARARVTWRFDERWSVIHIDCLACLFAKSSEQKPLPTRAAYQSCRQFCSQCQSLTLVSSPYTPSFVLGPHLACLSFLRCLSTASTSRLGTSVPPQTLSLCAVAARALVPGVISRPIKLSMWASSLLVRAGSLGSYFIEQAIAALTDSLETPVFALNTVSRELNVDLRHLLRNLCDNDRMSRVAGPVLMQTLNRFLRSLGQ